MDDWLDGPARVAAERLTFVQRQKALVDRCYAGEFPARASSEERMLLELIRADPDPQSPLAAYIRNMMSVMAFDAERRGRLISLVELAAYQRALAVAVTEALHYFIGDGDSTLHTPERYLAVTAAHITHMLRDTHEDLEAGYYNIPAEFLRQHNIMPQDVDSAAHRQWVQSRVDLAREYFRLGRRYIRSSGNARCQLAANLYAARFEIVLDTIERDSYGLRRHYRACKSVRSQLHMAALVFRSLSGLDRAGQATGWANRDRASGVK
jgi:phytoene/squalene synthetase